MFCLAFVDILDCTCDHDQEEKCPVCIRVSSPQVYRLDFTEEPDEQSTEQEVADGQDYRYGDRSDGSHGNKDQVSRKETDQNNSDSIKNTENPNDSNCDAISECDKDRLVKSTLDSDRSTVTVTNVVKTDINNANTNSDSNPKHEQTGKPKKGTKSKDIWPDADSSRVVQQVVPQPVTSSSNQVSSKRPEVPTPHRKPDSSQKSSNTTTR